MTLKEEILRNSGFSNVARKELVEWMEEVTTLVNELKTDYTAHIADDTSHAVADETNTVAAAAVTAIDAR